MNICLVVGFGKKKLDFFQVTHCLPHILGLNYYVTSERWLDESLGKISDHHTHGGNGSTPICRYRSGAGKPTARSGFKNLATEIWERYKIPMAVTESHLHCTREEQLRWFKEIWDDAIDINQRRNSYKGSYCLGATWIV